MAYYSVPWFPVRYVRQRQLGKSCDSNSVLCWHARGDADGDEPQQRERVRHEGPTQLIAVSASCGCCQCSKHSSKSCTVPSAIVGLSVSSFLSDWLLVHVFAHCLIAHVSPCHSVSWRADARSCRHEGRICEIVKHRRSAAAAGASCCRSQSSKSTASVQQSLPFLTTSRSVIIMHKCMPEILD